MNKENEQALAALILSLGFGELVDLSRQLGAFEPGDPNKDDDCWADRLGGEYIISLGLYSWAEGAIEQPDDES